jgi:hypothetical protein
MLSSHLPAAIRPPSPTILLAFLACGCRTVYDRDDRRDGEIVVCPNLYTCNGHNGGWTTITETLAGSLPRTAHAGLA